MSVQKTKYQIRYISAFTLIELLIVIALLGALAVLPYSNPSYAVSRVDERDDLIVSDERTEIIARMKKTMASFDTAKEDPTDIRDTLASPRECGWLL